MFIVHKKKSILPTLTEFCSCYFYFNIQDKCYPYYDDDVHRAWEMGYTGKGVTVGVVDTGVDYNHPDLTLNTVCFSFNFRNVFDVCCCFLI